jgi:hypoxanthine-DNA glycosylase
VTTFDADEKRSFRPITDDATRVLILGSLPGDLSLLRGQYYANPRNQFWRLVEAVSDVPFPDAGYEARLERLRAMGIGLWDVVKSAFRRGSLDAAIGAHVPNALIDFVQTLPALQAVAFNGAKAAKIGLAQLARSSRVQLLELPSSSPAHAVPFEVKQVAWMALRPYLSL